MYVNTYKVYIVLLFILNMVEKLKWTLYRNTETGVRILGTFRTKNDAIEEAKTLERINAVEQVYVPHFHYLPSFRLWDDTTDGTGYSIGKHGHPEVVEN
jgi:hypothetical protein